MAEMLGNKLIAIFQNSAGNAAYVEGIENAVHKAVTQFITHLASQKNGMDLSSLANIPFPSEHHTQKLALQRITPSASSRNAPQNLRTHWSRMDSSLRYLQLPEEVESPEETVSRVTPQVKPLRRWSYKPSNESLTAPLLQPGH
jgi:hypothetical protein